jgi:hypothetical protein
MRAMIYRNHVLIWYQSCTKMLLLWMGFEGDLDVVIAHFH